MQRRNFVSGLFGLLGLSPFLIKAKEREESFSSKTEKGYKVEEGVIKWFNEAGQLHRESGPAVEYSNGQKEWWLNNQRHREDGPAVEFKCGTKHWYKNGLRHREDGPAVELPDGKRFWYKNGKRYREDGAV